MHRDETIVRSAIARIAPEIGAERLAADIDWVEESGIDSIDFLAVLQLIRDETGCEIPERDFPRLLTIDAFAAYLDGAR